MHANLGYQPEVPTKFQPKLDCAWLRNCNFRPLQTTDINCRRQVKLYSPLQPRDLAQRTKKGKKEEE
jgi:hypothetical protein